MPRISPGVRIYTSTSATVAINAAINATVWNIWNGVYATNQIVIPNGAVAVTPEQQEARRRQDEEWRQRQAAQAREREKANERAEKLLMEHLSPQQVDQLRVSGYFDVVVQGKTYRINRGRAGNIQLLDPSGRKATHRYCIHPRELCPDADSMLAQKLLLEADEPTFLRTANATRLN